MSNGINLIKIQLYHEFTNKMSLILNLMAHSGEITTTTIYFNQKILQYDKKKYMKNYKCCNAKSNELISSLLLDTNEIKTIIKKYTVIKSCSAAVIHFIKR